MRNDINKERARRLGAYTTIAELQKWVFAHARLQNVRIYNGFISKKHMNPLYNSAHSSDIQIVKQTTESADMLFDEVLTAISNIKSNDITIFLCETDAKSGGECVHAYYYQEFNNNAQVNGPHSNLPANYISGAPNQFQLLETIRQKDLQLLRLENQLDRAQDKEKLLKSEIESIRKSKVGFGDYLDLAKEHPHLISQVINGIGGIFNKAANPVNINQNSPSTNPQVLDDDIVKMGAACESLILAVSDKYNIEVSEVVQIMENNQALIVMAFQTFIYQDQV